MFTRVQARSFRSLKAIDQSLGSFRALVGPNASGKTTFLDVIGFLGDLVRNRGEVIETVQVRSSNFVDLLWMKEGSAFQLAVEADIPVEIKKDMALGKQRFSNVRYEVEVGLDSETDEIGLNHETLWLVDASAEHRPLQERLAFPAPQVEVPSIFSPPRKGLNKAITKKPGGNDNYYTEGKKGYMPSFKLGRGKSALANLPADSESFPVSTWFRNLLDRGVQSVTLNSQVIRQPSRPGLGRRFQTDGSNLPWVVAELKKDARRFQSWLQHVQTALADIRDIDTIERPEDRHRYLVIEYITGAKIPSWLVSDGTLRLLALTIPAYLPDITGTFLIEEPENGIHPRAIETVIESLSSVYAGQVLVATHSPVALNMLDATNVLCFAKDPSGATDIVSGDLHPALRDWKRGEPDLGVLFASGILS
jgi:predicted ATPase